MQCTPGGIRRCWSWLATAATRASLPGSTLRRASSSTEASCLWAPARPMISRASHGSEVRSTESHRRVGCATGSAPPAGFVLTDGPYALGADAVCKNAMMTNCGLDFEGLCLAPAPDAAGSCVGFAASRATGALHCIALDGDRLAMAPGTIAISSPRALSGCAVSDDVRWVWAGTNVFGGSLVYRVGNWRDPAKARVERIAVLGAGFPEVVASAPGGVIYRISDTGTSPSLMNKYHCE